MNATSIRSPQELSDRIQIEWGAVWTWILCLGLLAYLSFEGGGYDPLVSSQAGIAVWWLVLLGALVGAMPRGRLKGPALAALALLALFAIWTALSLTWTESSQKTWADLARIAGYVGIFALALGSAGTGRGRQIVAALATGIAVIAVIALLSRLHPSWFPGATQTANLLNDPERLSFPLNYWNAVAALVAIGLPLILQQATEARNLLFGALAAAVFPAMALAIYFTISRGGVAAAVVAVAVFLAVAGDRLPKLILVALAGAGSAFLILTAESHDALRHGLNNAAAHDQGNSMLLLTIVVCLVVGLVWLGITAWLDTHHLPDWTRPGRQQVTTVSLVGLVLLAIAFVGVGGLGKVDNAWNEFRRDEGPGTGTSRLGSAAGESRYQFWSVAAEEQASKPLTGTGSGTFEFWWARNGTDDSVVKDTHSLWMQTFGELGIVGLVLLIGFFGVILVGGGERLLRLGARRRSPPAAALAGIVAFCLVATFDWMWQLPAMVATLLLLAAALLGPWGSSREGAISLRWPLRIGVAVVAAVAIVAIAFPFASTTQLRASETESRSGDLDAALTSARSAANVLPGTAGPRLQEALVLEEMGRFPEAVEAARAATEREETNWRNFLVLARVEAENGEAAQAVADYRTARSLYPRLALFNQT